MPDWTTYHRQCRECRRYFTTQEKYTHLCSLRCWGAELCRKWELDPEGTNDETQRW